VGTDGLTVSSGCVKAQLQKTASHDWLYTDNKDGTTHTVYCSRCNKVKSEAADHDYTYDTVNRKCICGAADPDYSRVTGVKVNPKKVSAYSGFLFRARKVTKVQYTISPETQNVSVKKVQYSVNGEKWKAGTVFTSDTQLNKFYIKVTDSNGRVTSWVYRDGSVSADKLDT